MAIVVIWQISLLEEKARTKIETVFNVRMFGLIGDE